MNNSCANIGQSRKICNVLGSHFSGTTNFLGFNIIASSDKWSVFFYCRLLHLVLLAFNILATKSLSAVSGGNKSIFSKKENASALVLVASQVIIDLS